MLAVALLFYPMTIDSLLVNAIKERLGDKYDRLMKTDEATVKKCLDGTPKVITPVLNLEHFKNYDAGLDQVNATEIQRSFLYQKLKALDRFSSLQALFKLYKTVTQKKLAKVMGKKQAEMEELFASYLSRRNLNFNNKSEFFVTVLAPLFKAHRETNIQVTDGIIEIIEPEQEIVNYSVEYGKCGKQLTEIITELDTIEFV